METTTRVRPKIRRNERRPDPGELARLLPPSLEQALSDEAALVEHRRVAERRAQLQLKFPELALALRTQQEADRVALGKAIRAGRQPKPSTAAEQIEREMQNVSAEIDATGELLADSAQRLLEAALPHVGAALEATVELEQATLDAATRKLEEAIALIEAAGDAAAERVWLAQLASTGETAPFGRGVTTRHPGHGEATLALHRLVEGRELRRHGVDEAARAEVALNVSGPGGAVKKPLPLPPGTEVWLMPGEGTPAEPEPAAAAGE